MARPRTSPSSGRPSRLRARLQRRLRRLRGIGPAGRTLAAAALTWGALLATLAVLGVNLGARDGIRYINGGKIFLERGAMWYHTPGLGSFELAPQNIGGQGNLRNNDVALFEPGLSRLLAMELDLSLAEGAYALVALDHQSEGTFTAVRISALQDPDSPFDNALVRFEDGREVERRPLGGPAARVTPGRHRLDVFIEDGGLRTVLDGHETTFRADLRSLRPAPGVGSGELDLTVHRWRVVGRDRRGGSVDWEEDWSLGSYLRGRVGGWLLVASLLWLMFFGLPVLAVSAATRRRPDRVLVATTLQPTPRLVYGALCLLPWMPLLPQLGLVANMLLLYLFGLVEQLVAHGRARPLPSGSGGPRFAVAGLGVALTVVGGALLAASVVARRAPVGSAAPDAAGAVLATSARSGALDLGVPRSLPIEPRPAGPVVVQTEVELQPDEVVRIDLLAQLPPDTDLFQVDRMSLFPSEEGAASGGGGQERFGHDFGGVSVLLSAADGLPSETLRAEGFGVERSHLPWQLGPGRHAVQITVALPYIEVAINGEVRELRDDLAGVFTSDDAGLSLLVDPDRALTPLGAVQVQAWSDRVSHVGPLVVRDASGEATAAAAQAVGRAGLLGGAGLLLFSLGLFSATLGVLRGRTPLRTLLLPLAGRFLRGHLLVLLLAALVVQEALGFGPGTARLPARALLVPAGLLAGVQLLVVLRAEKLPWVVALLGLTLQCGATVEAGSWLFPSWRHRTTTWWNHGLTPTHWWAYDPMLRRLNPWYIDMRFQRRPWAIDRPEGRTRIAVFGGSQTYGWGIPSRDRMTFSDRLQVELRDQGRDVEVLNAAFPGVKTTTGLRWFEGNLTRYQPDVIVVNFVVNEFMDIDTYRVWAGDRGPEDRVAPLTALALLRRVPADVRNRHIVQIVLAHRYQILEMEASLRRFVEIARERGIAVVFSVEPTNLYVESEGAEIMRNDDDAGAAIATYARLGDELSVPVYDGLPSFSEAPTDLLFFDTMHMSRHGHAVFARGLANLIDREVLPAREGGADDTPAAPGDDTAPPAPER